MLGWMGHATKAQLELQPNQKDPWRFACSVILCARSTCLLFRHVRYPRVMNDMPRKRWQPKDGKLAQFHFDCAHPFRRGDFFDLLNDASICAGTAGEIRKVHAGCMQ